MSSSYAQGKHKNATTFAELEKGFIAVPDSIQTSVYWYWLSDNISKDGVIKDLEAMKKVGINRAFIGNIGISDIPYGKVKLFSPEWWGIIHTALKTATRLGIEIGIFNSPGWSQSGGPWVKPKQGMRYLTSSEISVNGPMLLNRKLIKPDPDFQDVKVIAYPAPKDFDSDLRNHKVKLIGTPEVDNLKNLVDKNEVSVINLPVNKAFTLDFILENAFTARSLLIYPANAPAYCEIDLQCKINGVYQTIKHFTMDRTNPGLNVGFKPYAPVAISIPKITGKEFRLLFNEVSDGSGIAEIKFSSAPIVEDYMEKTLAKMWQTPYPYWNAYQWMLKPAIDDRSLLIDPDKIIDISGFISADGNLNWNVPPGKWIIERTGMLPTKMRNSPASAEGTGLETDKMSKMHIAAHFDSFLGEIMRRIPAEDRKTWKVAVEDSYETGSQNWTDDFIEPFKKVYGYDPLHYLPVLQGRVVGSVDRSDRFLWDLRRFVADQLAYEYVAGLREVSHKNGLTTWLENYGHWGFPGEFLQYGGQSDEVSGEFWSEGSLGAIENRAASSCAHIYGKTKVSAESLTCSRDSYSRYPALMKQRLDRFFTEGINNTLLHVYIQQPDEKMPGVNARFGNEFNRHNTWFYDMDDFLKYIKRCNLLLQQGKYVADVAYFISEDAPKMTGSQDPALPIGYSFDYINAEVIKTRMSVKDGRIVLPDGMSYKVLVLPKLETMRPELLMKIKQLVLDGAVVLGPKPSRSPSLQNFGKADEEVQQLAAQLWGSINNTDIKVNRLGKGMVINSMSLEEVFRMVNLVPDLKTNPTDSVLFIHRDLKEGSVYFISNQKDKSINIKPEFRIPFGVPELWDATKGTMRELSGYSHNSVGTTVPLTLAPFESAFVMFKKDDKTKDIKVVQPNSNYFLTKRIMKITGEWLVNFESKSIGPSNPVVFKELEDWSISKNDSIKYYSGAAYYHNTFKLTNLGKKERVILDLGAVSAIAKVKVNGIDVGGLWTSPYKVDISKALKSGNNELEIKVVNTWVNRLIGDSKLAVKERKTSVTYDKYTPQSKLKPSGLFGPVKLEIIK